jgi:hypothetical protein
MDSDSRHGCSNSRKTIEALPQALHNRNGRTVTINHYFQWNSANFANSWGPQSPHMDPQDLSSIPQIHPPYNMQKET